MTDPDESARTPTLRASFVSATDMQRAVEVFAVNGFDHTEVALIDQAAGSDPLPHQSDLSPALEEADGRHARLLHASGAATAAGLAAAGITVATGGLAAVAVGAAVVAAAAVGGLAHAVNRATNQAERREWDSRAADGRLVISVQVPTPGRKARAEAILQQVGARDITTV